MPTSNAATKSPMLFLNQIQDPNTSLRNWGLFLTEVNESIDQLNSLIAAYNRTIDLEDKKIILREVYAGYKQIVKKHPDPYITASQGYKDEIHHKLFYQLKDQFSQLGVDSLHDDAVYDRQSAQKLPNSPTEIFANMTPEKIADVLEILSMKAPTSFKRLTHLYSATDSEYAAFQAFLLAYSISPMGGTNSKNYKITPTPARKKLTGEVPCVLKVEYRGGMPKFLETEIRNKIRPNRLTPVAFERQGTTRDPDSGEMVTKTLVITDFCSGGDLMQHASFQLSPEDRIQSALSIYKQMAEILIQLENNDCAFTDMKNTNWLIDDKNFIQIADTKGFLPTTSGVLDRHSHESRWFGIVYTKHMDPPEFASASFKVDAAHAYMLGKNIYFYLMANKVVRNAGHNGGEYEFTDPVFASSLIGKRMEILIKSLIKPDPTKRMKVANALKTLNQIESDFNELVDLKTKCRRLLSEIQSFDLDASTSKQQAIYQNVEFEIDNRNDRQALLDLATVLETKLSKVSAHEIKEELTETIGKAEIIDKLRAECGDAINNIQVYGFVGNRALDEFLSERQARLTMGEASLDALSEMKSELKTALMKASLVFDLKSVCHALIDEIRKLEASADDPELQDLFFKKHARVDCVFDMNQLKQYKSSLDELLIQMQYSHSEAPSPMQKK